MRVATAGAVIQRAYEAGAISYPRTSARSLGASGRATVSGWGVRGDEALEFAPAPDPRAGRRPHEAVHVLTERLPGVLGGVPQHLLPESALFLDRLARSNVRAASRLPVERPKTDDLPAWARGLDWWRPAGDFPAAARSVEDGCDFVAQPKLFEFDAEEVAFEALVRERLARPSSIVEHAVRAVARGFVSAEGLAAAGHAALVDMPPSLMMPGLAHAVEDLLERDWGAAGAQPGPPVDLIERCFELMPELAPRLRSALARGDGDGDSGLKPAAVLDVSRDDRVPAERENRWSYWAARRRKAAPVEHSRQSVKQPAGEAPTSQPPVGARRSEQCAPQAAASADRARQPPVAATAPAAARLESPPDDPSPSQDRRPAAPPRDTLNPELEDDDRITYPSAFASPRPW